MNGLAFSLEGDSVLSTRMVAYNMLTAWHEGGRLSRDLYRKRDELSMECARELGQEAEDNAVWNGKIASWLREKVNAQ